MKIATLALLSAPLFIGVNAHAILLGYWDMDAATTLGKLPVNQGSQSGTVSGSFTEFSVGFIAEIQPDVTGTTDNILPPPPATNRATGFYRAATIYHDGAFEMNDFNFTGLTDANVSFAYRSENFFTWDSNLEVDYRVNDGSWVDFAEGLSFNSDWTVASIAFGSAVDGESNVDFRIRTSSWFSVSGFLDIDNVQVTAVPEPETYALLLGAIVIGGAFWRRRR